MAYFSNGSAGEGYQQAYCFKCRNYVDKKDGRGYGCAIWDLHLDYSYQLCNSKDIAKDMLDFLIPVNPKTHTPLECSMFLGNRKKGGIKCNAKSVVKKQHTLLR